MKRRLALLGVGMPATRRRLAWLLAAVGLVIVLIAATASATSLTLAMKAGDTAKVTCPTRIRVPQYDAKQINVTCQPAATTTTTRPATTTTVPGTTTTTLPSGGSWGCGQSLSNYGPDDTKMELNTDVFAPVQPFSATICGNNTNFYADVAAGSCGGCVQAYPSIKYRYNQSSWVGCCDIGGVGGSVPLPAMRSWTSSWNVTYDRSTNSQAAYDLWFANNCGALHGDAMVWVDTTVSRGTGGGPIKNAHLALDGRDVTLMQYGTPGVSVSETIFKFNTNEASGSINMLAVMSALFATGDLRACDSRGVMVANADFGYEVAGTGGVVKRFSVPDFHNHVVTLDGVDHQ